MLVKAVLKRKTLMSIPFDETTQAIYFLSGRNQDWMAGINQLTDGTVELHYRFRIYDEADPDNDPHSDKDQKHWVHRRTDPGASLQEALDAMQGLMGGLEAAGFKPEDGVSCTLIRGGMTLDQFAQAFSELPFVHKRSATLE